MTELLIRKQLVGLNKCPHCSTANPTLNLVWDSDSFHRSGYNSLGIINRSDGMMDSMWAVYCCSTCGSLISAVGGPINTPISNEIFAIFPKSKKPDEDLPDRAKRYLQQAYDSAQSPDAAAVMAASAVDAMLKELGYNDGSLYQRISKAVGDNVLTKNMADWAHHVRLEANRTRHADEDDPFVAPEEAKQVVEFVEALGQFLFVLPARMKKSLSAS